MVSLDAERLKRDLKSRVEDVKGLLSRQTPQARQMLRKLLADRLRFEPFEEGGRRGYRFSGKGTYARLLGGEALPPTVVAPRSDVRRWHIPWSIRVEYLRLIRVYSGPPATGRTGRVKVNVDP